LTLPQIKTRVALRQFPPTSSASLFFCIRGNRFSSDPLPASRPIWLFRVSSLIERCELDTD
jgi:hypothetical protein